MNSSNFLDPVSKKPYQVWLCGNCLATYGIKHVADECCLPCRFCGKIKRGPMCGNCLAKDRRENEIKRVEKAVDVTGTERGESEMFYCPITDRFYESVLDAAEDFEVQEEVPEFVLCCSQKRKELNIDRQLEQMPEDTYEDAELNRDAVRELLEAVKRFNDRAAIVYYVPDYSRKVRVPKREV